MSTARYGWLAALGFGCAGGAMAQGLGADELAIWPVRDGIYLIVGAGGNTTVHVGEDGVLVVDTKLATASDALLAAIKQISDKPIRYVINTHSHFDHASGLRTFAAEGATIVTHRENVPYYEQIWSYPRTIAPDRLARSGRAASLEGVVGARTFDDGSRRLVVYHYGGNLHNAGMLMVFLPRERILIEADSYTPPAGPNDPPGGLAFLTHFYEAVEALRLDVDQVVPIHGRLVTLDEVRQAVERFGETQLWRN